MWWTRCCLGVLLNMTKVSSFSLPTDISSRSLKLQISLWYKPLTDVKIVFLVWKEFSYILWDSAIQQVRSIVVSWFCHILRYFWGENVPWSYDSLFLEKWYDHISIEKWLYRFIKTRSHVIMENVSEHFNFFRRSFHCRNLYRSTLQFYWFSFPLFPRLL